MPDVRNVSSDALDVNLFGLHFEAGETITVDDATAQALETNPNFEQVAPEAPPAKTQPVAPEPVVPVNKEQSADGN